MASSAVDLGRTSAALIAEDAALLDGLARQPLSDDALTHACRLVMRYECTPYRQLAERAVGQLEAWGLDRRQAFLKARRLWFSGFRPSGVSELLSAGSGADTACGN